VLLTRSRLCPGASPGSSLHLHVLSTPPAFVLSQDQTLREELLTHVELSMRHTRGCSYTWSRPGRVDGVLLYCLFLRLPASRTTNRSGGRQVEPGRTQTVGRKPCRQVRMLLSFQRPSRLAWRGLLLKACRAAFRLPERAAEYSAPERLPKERGTRGPSPAPGNLAGLADGAETGVRP
jgi:hypothetical protein